MESILITGASGFIGSFIVEEALKRKFGVWAGIRPTSSKKVLEESEDPLSGTGLFPIPMNCVPNSPDIKGPIISLTISSIVRESRNVRIRKLLIM